MANTKKKKDTVKSGEKKKFEDVQNGIKKDAKLVGKDEDLTEDREEASIGAHDTSASKPPRTKQKVPNRASSKSTSGLPTSMYTPFTVAAVAVVSYFAYQGYWETRINTPFSDQKVVVSTGLEEPDRYWGTYRPGVYFGVRTREPKSLLGGLMWFIPRLWAVGDVNLRHNCEQGDNLDSYGWLEHDGRNFGYQDIQDKFVRMSTAFVKRQGGLNGGDWTAKIQVEPRVPEAKDELVSVMFYFTLDEGAEGRLVPVLDGSGTAVTSIIGSTPSLGEFQVHFHNGHNVTLNSYLSTNIPSPHVVKDVTMRGMRMAKHDGQQHVLLGGDMLFGENQDKLPNLVVFNAMGKLPFDIEIVYESTSNYERVNRLAGNVFDKALQKHQLEFRQKFEDTFQLAKKGFPEKDIIFAKAAMSNMIGGIGYFYGTSRVQSAITKEPVPYWPAPLYTAVPSRSFFPRGFLWDEGFHNLLIAKWDKEISQDIIAHWLDLMNVEGWIPREQILGIEARVRVPDEFVVQKNSNANPPTLLLTLYELFGEAETISQSDVEYLQRAWPRLVNWYNWFNTTQIGKEPGSYYWRGRDANTLRELNPKSFSSGLDDFPRASHPTEDERHLDLRCWMALASKLMSHIAELIGRDGSKFTETWKSLSDNKMLDRVHWSTKAQMFADYGLHSSKVKLKRPKTNPNMPRPEMIREVVTPPTLGYVDDTFGYVNLFPLFTEILDPASPKLEKLMEDLRSPKHLWTNYGLRSLSKSSPLYDKRNTEHDPPYWRGPIWINMNYLAVKSLFHYANVEGPYQTRAKTLYNELRENVITNVIREYYRTGYIWEQYSDKSGEGQGCKPFTGWSSLVVLMMAESY